MARCINGSFFAPSDQHQAVYLAMRKAREELPV